MYFSESYANTIFINLYIKNLLTLCYKDELDSHTDINFPLYYPIVINTTFSSCMSINIYLQNSKVLKSLFLVTSAINYILIPPPTRIIP